MEGSCIQGAEGGEGALETGRLVVLVQVRLESEGLVAAFALEVLEGRVGLHVGSQVGPVGERLPAVGAAERLLPRVGPHVALKEPGPAEGLPAHVALVLEVVGEEVHGHGGHRHVHLPAGRTLLGHLAVQRAVGLLVAAQVGRRGVGFAALVAGVPLDGARTPQRFPPRPAVRDEEGVHRVALAHRCVAVDVTVGDLGSGAVGRLGVGRPVVAMETVVEGVRGRHFEPAITLAIVHHRADVVTDVAGWRGEKNKTKALVF